MKSPYQNTPCSRSRRSTGACGVSQSDTPVVHSCVVLLPPQDKLGRQCMTWLGDPVASIREAATKTLQKVAQDFGPEWTREHIVPPVLAMIKNPHYLYRMTVLAAIASLAAQVRCGRSGAWGPGWGQWVHLQAAFNWRCRASVHHHSKLGELPDSSFAVGKLAFSMECQASRSTMVSSDNTIHSGQEHPLANYMLLLFGISVYFTYFN